MSLDCLPGELYSAILSHVPPTDLRQTVLFLTRALPRSPIPLHHLFESISIVHPGQAVRLNKRIRAGILKQRSTIDASHWVHRLSVETWQVDADVLINLISLLPNLEALNLWVGPSNFELCHLEELFSRYMPTLRSLSVRFRPYVQKANYLQFLKAAYFDNMLLALSKWPRSPQGLPTLSIVQDPDTTQIKNFAQPIVFFRLDLNLSLLVHSPAAAASLKSLRIRIPGRNVVPALTTAYLNPESPVNNTAMPPPIEFLDISTCAVSESDIEALLARLQDLKHLILDECTGLLRGGPGQAMGQEFDWWSALGRRCALAGMKKARDRERQLKAWLEAQTRLHGRVGEDSSGRVSPNEPRRPRRGRRGLATATISLRGATSPPRSVPSVPATRAKKNTGVEKIHIIPPLPTLLSISLHPTSKATANHEPHSRIFAEFEKGWNDGIRVIWERRGRMGSTFLRGPTNGPKLRFLKFKCSGDRRAADEEVEECFEGLEDVTMEDERMFFRPDDAGLPAVLCLAGNMHDGHSEGCGHSIA